MVAEVRAAISSITENKRSEKRRRAEAFAPALQSSRHLFVGLAQPALTNR